MPYSIIINNLNYSLAVRNTIQKTVIKDLNLKIPFSEKGSITSVIAPFAAGKSTLLKIICGVEKQNSGTVEIYNDIKNIVPLIPENNSNLPWLNVEENVFEWARVKNEEFNQTKINQVLSDVGLSNYNKFRPRNVNSGFQFRIALARALTLSPKIILIDDSFKKFDFETRKEIYSLLGYIKNNYQINFILATTNLIEAIYLSDLIFLMSKNPAQIIYEKIINTKFSSVSEMLNSEFFTKISEDIRKAFKENGGITLIHYSV